MFKNFYIPQRKILLLSTAYLFCIFFFLNNCQVSSQVITNEEDEFRYIKPTTCEENIALLEAAHNKASAEGFLIMIGKLGENELVRDLNKFRLYNAKTYLTKYLEVRNPNTIILAEGQNRNKGKEGVIEIYVEGKLFGTLIVKEGFYLQVGSCEPKEMESPEQKRKRKYLYPEINKKEILKEWQD